MVYYPPEKKFDLDKIVNGSETGTAKRDLTNIKKKNKFTFKKIAAYFSIFAMILIISGGYMAYKANSTFDKITGQQNSILKSILKMLPIGNNVFQILPVESEDYSAIDKMKDKKLDRLNILLLGIRGIDDPNGGLLTDTMMVVSVKLDTESVALISVPRDLYVKMPNHDFHNKINEAYVLGIKDKKNWKGGLEYSKKAISDITGLDIHYAMSIDFNAFKEIIDTLGGITIILGEPFLEKGQFEEGPIELPAGTQLVNGKTALLFARARFSSSDFDRAKRQQQILLAVKEKAFSLGVLSNPVKVISIMNSIGNHLKTDAELWEIQEMAVLAKKIDSSNVKRKVFDTSAGGLLYASRDSNGSYILLPEGGNFDKIKEASKDIFN